MAESKTFNYEKSIKRLEEIVTLLSEGNASLEQSMKLFEEATKISARCNEYLNKAELKVEELSAVENG